MSAAPDSAKISFNPSWMGSTFCAGAGVSGQADQGTILAPPKMADRKYGREEVLALREAMANEDPPDELTVNFPHFYLADAVDPICITQFTDVEERLLHHVGINSSKAMSAVSHAERAPAPFQNQRWSQEERGERPTRGHYGGRGGGGGPNPYGGRGGYHRDRGVERVERGEREPDNRFGERGRGRGGHVTSERGGGGANGDRSVGLNPRAQGLYDPKDPRDRPRPRPRTTSTGEERGTTTGGYARGGGRYNHKGEQELPEWAGSDEEVAPDPMREDGTFDDQGQFTKSLPSGSRREEGSPIKDTREENTKRGSEKKVVEKVASPVKENSQTAAQATDFLRSVVGLGSERSVNTDTPQSSSHNDSNVKSKSIPKQEREEKKTEPKIHAKEQKTNSAQSFANKADQDIAQRTLEQQVQRLVHSTQHNIAKTTTDDTSSLMSGPLGALLGSLANVPRQPQTSVNDNNLGPLWFYLDPKKDIQGPFKAPQMQKWLQAGYFTPDLLLRNEKHNNFRTLANYLNERGQSLFSDQTSPSLPQPQKNSQSLAGLPGMGLKSIWGDDVLSALTQQDNNSKHKQQQLIEERERLEREQRRIADLEQRVKREQEQRLLVEEEMRRKEELMRRQQAELELRQRQQEEIQKRAREEMARREAAERDRQRIELLGQQAELQRQQRLQDEIERKRKEADERAKKENEDRLRREQELMRMREVEERKIMQVAERQRKEDEARRQQIQQERVAAIGRENEGGQRITLQDLFAAQSMHDNTRRVGNTHNLNQQQPLRWGATPVEQRIIAGNVLSLQEIQKEEERQIEAERRQEDIRRQQMQQSVASAASTVWGHASKSINWAPEDPRPAKSNPWGKSNAPEHQTQQHGFWDDPVPDAPSKKEVKPKRNNRSNELQNNHQQKSDNVNPKETQNVRRLFANALAPGQQDELSEWVVRQVQQLSPDMDASTFASFLMQVDAADEVRDYIEGYFGDNRNSSEFLQNFLQKRSQKKRKDTPHRDDLAMPAPALMPDSSKDMCNDAPTNKARKKKGKIGRPVDSSVLGFTATGDPNRMNVGDIDSMPPH